MDDKTAKRVRREQIKLKNNYKKLQNKLWKTSFSSPDFIRYQNEMKDIVSELESRKSEFNLAFNILFNPTFNNYVEKKPA